MKRILSLIGVAALLLVTTSCGQEGHAPLYERSFPHPDEPDAFISLLDRVVSQGVPKPAAEEAFDFFDANPDLFPNKEYMSILDFSVHSTEERWFLIELNTGEVTTLLVSHGRYSDPDHDGYANKFSNIVGSGMSSLGFYRTAERYYGKHGLSMRLDGLESSNSNARKRYIVVHGADYVDPNWNPLGRSLGCPAVERKWIRPLVDMIEEGSLLYIYLDS